MLLLFFSCLVWLVFLFRDRKNNNNKQTHRHSLQQPEKKIIEFSYRICCRIKIERECIEFGSSAVSSSKCVCQIFYSHQEYRSVCKRVCYGYACVLCIGCSACLSVQSALVCYVVVVVVIVVLSLRSLTKNIYDYVAPKMYIETKITQD